MFSFRDLTARVADRLPVRPAPAAPVAGVAVAVSPLRAAFGPTLTVVNGDRANASGLVRFSQMLVVTTAGMVAMMFPVGAFVYANGELGPVVDRSSTVAPDAGTPGVRQVAGSPRN